MAGTQDKSPVSAENGKMDFDLDNLRDKVHGVIFGAALGDAVGLATEFMSKANAKIVYGNGPIKFGLADGHTFWRDGHRRKWHENDFTDDTDQLLLILQCILETNGNLIPEHFAYRLKEWLKIGFLELEKKWACGVGYTVGCTLSHPEFITNPHKASFDIWDKKGRNLAANGAVMRTSVLGIPFFWDEIRVVENAIKCAKVTHADPRSVVSSVIVSVIISQVLCKSLDLPCTFDEHSQSVRDRLIFLLESGSGSVSDTSEDNKNEFKIEPKPDPLLSAPTDEKGKDRSSKGIFRNLWDKVFNSGETKDDISSKFPPEWPRHKDPDNRRLQTPAELTTKAHSLNSYGADESLRSFIKEVVHRYKFLLTDSNILCNKDTNAETAAKWEEELFEYCMGIQRIGGFKLDETKCIGYTYKCLGSALFCFSRKIPESLEISSGDFFKEVITELVLEAGDADTNGAVAGALLGVRLGFKGLPEDWVNGLRHFKFLQGVSDQLFEMVKESMEIVNWLEFRELNDSKN